MNIEWNIVEMDRKADNGFVTNVHYIVTAIDGEFSAYSYGTISFEEKDSFKAFDKLTKDEVISWVKNALDVEKIEENLSNEINLKKNPVLLTGFPWN